jgi:L-iditol 2-dehydrogenase
MANKAAFMTAIRKIEIEDVPMPVPKDDEVLVKLEHVGICGSDVHYLENGRIGSFVVEGKFILGHECAGIVEAIGKNVKSLKIGDKVALEPGQTCGCCEFCKGGKYNLCPLVEFLATPPYQGCYSNYIAHPEDLAFKLPDNVGTMEGSLVEPLAVGIHSAKQGGVSLGSSVIILGAGCIGLMTLLACKAMGASDITLVDIVPKRLDCATTLGATRVINALECDVVEEIAHLTDNNGADIVFETAGSEATIKQTAYLVKNGGTIVLVGMVPNDIVLYDFSQILAKEAQIKSVFRYRNIYPIAINAISSGHIDVSGIVSHVFNFNDIGEAFDFVIENKNDVVKAVIKI